jgi:tetratricopeptide (TPR) repeat protein
MAIHSLAVRTVTALRLVLSICLCCAGLASTAGTAGLASTAGTAGLASTAGAMHFQEGLGLYEAEDFRGARRAFARAVEVEPDESEYHHWLGKSFGRIAERSSFLPALAYAQRTRRSLEYAVELDPANRDALWSLMQFYEEAPGFLGGGEEKAAELRRRIEAIDAAR